MTDNTSNKNKEQKYIACFILIAVLAIIAYFIFVDKDVASISCPKRPTPTLTCETTSPNTNQDITTTPNNNPDITTTKRVLFKKITTTPNNNPDRDTNPVTTKRVLFKEITTTPNTDPNIITTPYTNEDITTTMVPNTSPTLSPGTKIDFIPNLGWFTQQITLKNDLEFPNSLNSYSSVIANAPYTGIISGLTFTGTLTVSTAVNTGSLFHFFSLGKNYYDHSHKYNLYFEPGITQLTDKIIISNYPISAQSNIWYINKDDPIYLEAINLSGIISNVSIKLYYSSVICSGKETLSSPTYINRKSM